jgi:adenine/guanine phosphoribosyltransferase-like PRPP-binding protein
LKEEGRNEEPSERLSEPLPRAIEPEDRKGDALRRGDSVVIVDDLLATGGTAMAAAKLVELLGARVDAFAFLVELAGLGGQERLRDYEVFSLIRYA